MAITIVAGQTASGTAAASLTVALVLTSNPTTGNLVVVAVMNSNAAVTLTAQDANGNVYTASPNSPATNSGRSWIFYLKNAPANADKTITVTASVAANLRGWILEAAGADTVSPLETDAKHEAATSQSNIDLPALTTVSNGCLLVGVARVITFSITSADAPWTGIDIIRSGNYAEYYIQPTAGTQAVAFTQGGAGQWSGNIAAFRAAGGGKLFDGGGIVKGTLIRGGRIA